MIEYRFHICADLTYFLLAHIKVKNAADTYDEDYIANMSNLLNGKPVITEKMTDYYNENFDRLAAINFVPLLTKDKNELVNMFNNLWGINDEDKEEFITPFCVLLDEWEQPYTNYWKKYVDSLEDKKIEVFNSFDQQISKFSSFFDRIYQTTKLNLRIVFSHSLKKNGRAFSNEGMFYVMLPFPDETHLEEEVFFQLIHECTHLMTDPLIPSIRMDDGSHDTSEYQVLLFDLWLFEKFDAAYAEKYTSWIPKEILDECYNNLTDDRIAMLKNILS